VIVECLLGLGVDRVKDDDMKVLAHPEAESIRLPQETRKSCGKSRGFLSDVYLYESFSTEVNSAD
jgi:hypothetical protein